MSRNMDIREVVKDPDWQQIRTCMVGTWKLRPETNVQILRLYLKDFTDPLRLRRVHNYLTGSAFRMRIIQHPEIDLLLDEVRKARA